MEKIRYEINLRDEGLELRCRDSCPCGYTDLDNSYIPTPKEFK